MEIVQVKDKFIRAENYRIEDRLPDFDKIKKEWSSAIDLKRIIKEEQSGEVNVLNLVGYFNHEDYIMRYGNTSFCGLLEKLQQITGCRLILDTSGNDWEITIYDDYIE